MGCNCNNSANKFKTAIFKRKADASLNESVRKDVQSGEAGQELLSIPDKFLTKRQRRTKQIQIRANRRNARIARRQLRNQQN